jgi:hypothetical protein
MGKEDKYRNSIQSAIDTVKGDYEVNYSLRINSDPLHKGGVPDAFGTIKVELGRNTKLDYSFEIDSLGAFCVGKVFGIGNDNVHSLNKILELNKTISNNLGSMLVERELEIDLLRKAK